MPQPTIRIFFIVIALALVSATVALAQSPAPVDLPAAVPATDLNTAILAKTPTESWQVARSTSSSRGKILVVTLDQPKRRQSCHVQSFTDEKIVCSRAFGGSRTYLKQQVAALILPGDGALTVELFAGLNAGLGASIWGTVVLVAACPACAAATAFAALVCFAFAGAVAYSDNQPERVAYIAPGEKWTARFGSVAR